MHVIGTAGHVDHGKSTLVKALTGIDPDRLAEEKAREMTIDLGFAWLNLGDSEVGIVDVPGHRDFIENMLAGVGGIDLALFVIAADEGIMPQTREHLAILDLLEVDTGIVALTKVDLIDDPEWLDLVLLEISEEMNGTVLDNAPIVPVSSFSGEGLDELRVLLQEQLQDAAPRPDYGRPRLPVDRVFTLSGFGTIITGTLLDGHFQIGDAVEIQPAGLKGRIRGLQTHKQKLEKAAPGSRVAINLTGISRQDIKRGDVITAPGTLVGTILIDALYRHLPDADGPLKHNMQVKLFVGSAEVVARTRVIGSQQIDPGQGGWLQLALQEPIAVMRGDRFILRRPSPGETLGGGTILDPYPGRKRRRFKVEEVERLKTLSEGTPAEIIIQTLTRIEPVSAQELIKESGLDPLITRQALDELDQVGDLIQVGNLLMTTVGWDKLLGRAVEILRQYHQEFPLRLGMPREELRSRLRLKPAVFNRLIEESLDRGSIQENGSYLLDTVHVITFSASQQKAVDSLLVQFQRSGAASPSVKESKAVVGDDVYGALVDLGILVQLNQDVVYAKAQYDHMVSQIIAFLKANGQIDAAQTRDLLKTSRKYAIALLEHLDDIRVTRRMGDHRILTS
ncbi:MAG: selenocysteine-specific translation elongation factor [Candidatus Promineifilaceae bacterium]|nr:selenocysteine-specific translation elongation factor [Candidatus Promineifilaceae bacterium]